MHASAEGLREIPVELQVGAGDAPAGLRACGIAGRTILVDRRIAALRPFALGGPAQRPTRALPAPDPVAGTVVFDGDAWAAGRLRRVTCRRAGSLLVVSIPGVAVLSVTRGCCRVDPAAGASRHLPDPACDAALGPGLLLALALEGVFALHAAAVAVGGGVVLLVGESGAGKSTIGAALGDRPGSELLADDIVPVELSAEGLLALPHYPQLKLPPTAQYGKGRPSRRAVKAIYELRGSASHAAAPVVEATDLREATLLLAAQTVAGCLFDAPLLERHLDFCADAARRIPVRRLRFGKRLETLPDVTAAVLADVPRG